MEGIDWCDDLQSIPSCPIQLLPAPLRVGMSTAQVDVHGRKVVGTPAPALNPGFRPIATQTPRTDLGTGALELVGGRLTRAIGRRDGGRPIGVSRR